MKKRSLRIHLDIDLLNWLRKEAEERHCSMAQLIRTLLVQERKKADRK